MIVTHRLVSAQNANYISIFLDGRGDEHWTPVDLILLAARTTRSFNTGLLTSTRYVRESVQMTTPPSHDTFSQTTARMLSAPHKIYYAAKSQEQEKTEPTCWSNHARRPDFINVVFDNLVHEHTMLILGAVWSASDGGILQLIACKMADLITIDAQIGCSASRRQKAQPLREMLLRRPAFSIYLPRSQALEWFFLGSKAVQCRFHSGCTRASSERLGQRPR